jgi:hypothetical protein
MSPKERFRQSDYAKGWNDLCDSARFQAGADAAMLQMQQGFSIPPDMATSSAQGWMLQGAKQFLWILQNLNTSVEQPKPKDYGLNPNA